MRRCSLTRATNYLLRAWLPTNKQPELLLEGQSARQVSPTIEEPQQHVEGTAQRLRHGSLPAFDATTSLTPLPLCPQASRCLTVRRIHLHLGGRQHQLGQLGLPLSQG
jgi:hypothetical protein